METKDKMKKAKYGNKEYEYDELAPCIICGEPVHNASMGGTVVCPACDCGKCRFCNETVFVLKEKLDGGESKRRLLEHMEEHRKKLGLKKVYTEKELFEARVKDKLNKNKESLNGGKNGK